jgi:hypothetical protein
MKIEYHTFDVEPWLASKRQPSFTVKGVEHTSKYYTLTDLERMQYSVTTSVSEGVRVPVFGVSTSAPQEQPENVRELGHGSMLFAMGMENALQFLDSLILKSPVSRAVIVIATNCHALENSRYRAYFGITLEVD